MSKAKKRETVMAHKAQSPFLCGEGNLSGFDAGFADTRRTACAVTTLELVDAASGIEELLFTREKRMAGGANADFDIVVRRTSAISRAASTCDHGLVVFRMNL